MRLISVFHVRSTKINHKSVFSFTIGVSLQPYLPSYHVIISCEYKFRIRIATVEVMLRYRKNTLCAYPSNWCWMWTLGLAFACSEFCHNTALLPLTHFLFLHYCIVCRLAFCSIILSFSHDPLWDSVFAFLEHFGERIAKLLEAVYFPEFNISR